MLDGFSFRGTYSLFVPKILEWLHLWRAFGEFESADGTPTHRHAHPHALITILFVFNQLWKYWLWCRILSGWEL